MKRLCIMLLAVTCLWQCKNEAVTASDKSLTAVTKTGGELGGGGGGGGTTGLVLKLNFSASFANKAFSAAVFKAGVLIGVIYAPAPHIFDINGDFETSPLEVASTPVFGCEGSAAAVLSGSLDIYVMVDNNAAATVQAPTGCPALVGLINDAEKGYLTTVNVTSGFLIHTITETDLVDTTQQTVAVDTGNAGQTDTVICRWHDPKSSYSFDSNIFVVGSGGIALAGGMASLNSGYLPHGTYSVACWVDTDASSTETSGDLRARIDNVVIDGVTTTTNVGSGDFIPIP